MGRFVIQCPSCGSYTTASHIFHRHVQCNCGNKISVSRDRMAAKVCPNCKNTVVYDQAKGEKAICPVCKEPVNTTESMKNAVEIHCPSCSCKLIADRAAPSDYHCPLCDALVDVQKQYAKEKIKDSGLASVIKYEGGNDVLVWKHPIEDFNLGSQLIVHESQEALFFRDGQALDLFGAGRYTLATQTLPLLEDLYKLPVDSDTVFHSEVYFINLTTQMGIKWGTDSKVRLFDPASGLHVELGAFGRFNLRVINSRKFVLKVVGTEFGFTQKQVFGNASEGANEQKESHNSTDSIVRHFRALIISKIKTFLSKTIKENNINILEIDEYTDLISENLRVQINEVLEEYGLTMPEFFVTSINLPDDNPDFARMKRQFAEKTLKVRQEEILKAEAEAAHERKVVMAKSAAEIKTIGAQGDADALRIKAMAEADAYRAQAMAEAEEMRMKGFTYQQETARQVSMEAMKNGITGGEGGSGMLGDIAGLGVTLGAVGGVINLTKDAINPMINDAAQMGAGVTGAAGLENQEICGKIKPAYPEPWDCDCGKKGIKGNFCSNCGSKRPEAPETWDCDCGKKGISGNFCSNCGNKKPEAAETWDCNCGKKGIAGNFCSNCGSKKPEKTEAWNCDCGHTNKEGMFCLYCGKKKPEKAETWDCDCGQKDIDGIYCTKCGSQKKLKKG